MPTTIRIVEADRHWSASMFFCGANHDAGP